MIRICLILFWGVMMERVLYAETPDLFRFADSLKQAGNFEYAAIEYERNFFYGENSADRVHALIQKAECLKALNSFNKAEKCLMRVNYSDIPDSVYFTARYQTALCAYLAGNFSNAESQLIQLFAENKYTKSDYPVLPLYVFVLNELMKWEEAQKKCREWILAMPLDNNVRDSLYRIVDDLYRADRQPRLKKQGTAKILSSIIPGSGQAYAGFWGEGMANAFLQGTSLLLTAYGIYTGYYVTSAVITFGLFQKFYSGAIVRTDYLVQKKNYELVRHYNDLLKNELLLMRKKGE